MQIKKGIERLLFTFTTIGFYPILLYLVIVLIALIGSIFTLIQKHILGIELSEFLVDEAYIVVWRASAAVIGCLIYLFIHSYLHMKFNPEENN